MSTVIETLAEYETFLRFDLHIKDTTFRRVSLSLSYFTQLFGIAETKELKVRDIYIFYEWLKKQKRKKKKDGVYQAFSSAHLRKTMTHLKSYIRRLHENGQTSIFPGQVPRGKISAKKPEYLTKEDMSILMNYLETNLAFAIMGGNQHRIYSAYLWRAVIWMLYTSGLRNFELRSLTDDIRIDELKGTIFGKGDKWGIYTFSELAKEKLLDYLEYRRSLFPEMNFKYLFTLYEKGSASQLTEHKLNIGVKTIGTKAGIQQNIHPHIFRHTLGTHLLQDGRTIVDVKDKLRHENIATTSIYVHSNPVAIQTKTQSLGADFMGHTD